MSALCTDNKAKLKLMKDLMKNDNELREIITHGCSAHCLNLLEKVVIPLAVMKHVVEEQNYFCSHQQPHGWMKEKDGMMSQIPDNTHWNSLNACLSTFTKNFYKYVEISNVHMVLDNNGKILSKIHLCRKTVELRKQVSVVSEALDALQTDSATLFSVIDMWKSYSRVKCFNHTRMKEAIKPFFYEANLMDSNSNGVHLSSEQEDQAEKWIWIKEHKPHSDILCSSILEPQVLSICKHSPSKWWMLMESRTAKKNANFQGDSVNI